MEKNVVFKVNRRTDGRMMRVIHASAFHRHITIYLDHDTAMPIYPISIETEIVGVTITLDSDIAASCTSPPVIPESMADKFAACLETVHETVAAARKLIKDEQQLFKSL